MLSFPAAMVLQGTAHCEGKAVVLFVLLLGFGFAALRSLPQIRYCDETATSMALAPSTLTELQRMRTWQYMQPMQRGKAKGKGKGKGKSTQPSKARLPSKVSHSLQPMPERQRLSATIPATSGFSDVLWDDAVAIIGEDDDYDYYSESLDGEEGEEEAVVTAGAKPTKYSSDGRVVLQEKLKRKKKKRGGPKLCSGCGCEVIAGEETTVAGGDAAKAASFYTSRHKARYSDVTGFGAGFVCRRCKALSAGNVYAAYDALQDLEPGVFKQQLAKTIARRKFGLCIKVVDAADFEGSVIDSLRGVIKSMPVILVATKKDLLPLVGQRELTYMKIRARNRNINCVEAHAVSGLTGDGIAGLAEAVLGQLGGRDVFVVGAANVGKSTLVKALAEMIATNVHFKGGSKSNRRKKLTTDLKVTASHLPGTTLQAIRVPCFASRGHALWDTPGIISDRSLTYSIFPPHLMEPLAKPQPIEIRETFRLAAGETLVLEASWLRHEAKPAPALGRLDVLAIAMPAREVELRVFAPPAISVRVVPTSEAPETVDIDMEVVRAVQRQIGGNSSAFVDRIKQGLPIEYFNTIEPKANNAGRFVGDVCFSSIGWVSYDCRRDCRISPRAVQGSVWRKRDIPFYLNNLAQQVKRAAEPSRFADLEEDPQLIKQRLTDANREGKHLANTRRAEKERQNAGGAPVSDWWNR